MSARPTRSFVIAALATLVALALPALAVANPTELSAVDAISADVSVDGSADTSSASTTSEASDSPTVDTYSGGGESVPPPVDCDAPATDSSAATSSDPCAPIVECSSADTDGLDANGKPCVECSSVDTDGVDASGKACVPATETVTETPSTCVPATDAGSGVIGGGAPATTVCGGGGGPVDDPVDPPVAAPEVVDGGGLVPAPGEAPRAAGGGGPELPFTGLPLWYAIYGGLGLILLGGALWARSRFGGQPQD